MNEFDEKYAAAKEKEQERKEVYENLLKEFRALTEDLRVMKIEYKNKEQEYKERFC